MEQAVIAKVALDAANYAIDKPYDYRIPTSLAGSVAPGVRVLVPFGVGNRRSEGLVLALSPDRPDEKLKSITQVLDESPVLDGDGLKLALWMRERYFCTVFEAVRTILPAGLLFAWKDTYVLCPGADGEALAEAARQSEQTRRLLECIVAWGGRGELGKLRLAMAPHSPNAALRQLTAAGILSLEVAAQRGASDKTKTVASLLLSPEEALAKVTPRQHSAPMRYAATAALCASSPMAAAELCYYTGASMATLRSLAKSGILSLTAEDTFRRPAAVTAVPTAAPVVLNTEQQQALDGLTPLLEGGTPSAALLYGVTGSGKTQVYLKLIGRTLDMGRTALVLVPEIALTPQMLHVFSAHFGDRVALLHSSLRAGERYDEWKRVRSGLATVVVGTRSAVFAPLPNLGLIVVDEEQEGSYKSEQSPRYHAVEVAKYRAVQHNALVVMGSATPSVETMYQAEQGRCHQFTLKNRYNARALPQVHIADMRKELQEGNGGSISALLRRELEDNLSRGEQSILFLNRRGASRMMACGECGEVPQCPRCSVYLTYHSANGRLMCHHCGHSEKLVDYCPRCGGLMNAIGAGTQKVEEELSTLFPGVEIIRMDADTVSATRTHDDILTRFQTRRTPILLGTQMVAKGLDFPNVTLVGVLAADLSLYVDSFRAAERTFSLLTQVVGRAGRGEKTGRAVLQTWTPENDVVLAAAAQDYDSFYRQELALRQLRGAPPFSDHITITASGPDETGALRCAARLRSTLEDWLSPGNEIMLFGPAPAAVAKVNNRYRYRITLLCKADRAMRTLVAQLLRAAKYDRENRGIAVFADINPME